MGVEVLARAFPGLLTFACLALRRFFFFFGSLELYRMHNKSIQYLSITSMLSTTSLRRPFSTLYIQVFFFCFFLPSPPRFSSSSFTIVVNAQTPPSPFPPPPPPRLLYYSRHDRLPWLRRRFASG